ncbi:MAG: FtsX-like permease family protein [Actinobacteria bacterium]|nr:FtsX-like permease family protein [Actinomycetota bacterium]
MLRAALKGVVANKLRLVLTALAIVIGVAFVAASFIFTDTINARFETLFTEISAGVDVYVRPVPPETGNDLVELGSLPDETLAQVQAVPGVRVAEGIVIGYAQFVGADGHPVGGLGPPTLGFSWRTAGELGPMTIAPDNGRAPTGPGEVVSDVATAERAEFGVGDTVTILTLGPPEQFEVVGLANFGSEDNLAGATTAAFELEEARRLFDLEGSYIEISAAAEEGVDAETLAADIDAATGGEFDVKTTEAANADQLSEIGEALGFLNTALLAFAAVAVFVGAFIIANTFRIIVAQRTRELALLRAIGATGGQVTRLVVIEALVVAVIASLIGVLGGIALALLLAALMNAIGFNLPEGPLTIAPRTVIIAMTVGVVVTVVAALLPARKAAKIPLVAAMHEELARTGRKPLQRRAAAGAVVTAGGVGLLLFGLFGSVANPVLLVGIGALVTFLGISILAPLAARPIANTIGWPLPLLFNTTGLLAKENTARQPRRTASTASALMIGVALVVFVAIFAASIKSTFKESIFDNFRADLNASSTNFQIGISPAFAEEMAALDEFDTVSSLVFDTALVEVATGIGPGAHQVGGVDIIVVDPLLAEEVVNLDPSPGAFAALESADGVVVSSAELEDNGWVVGDTIVMGFPKEPETQMEILGSFGNDDFGQYILNRDFYNTVYDNPFDSLVLATVAPGVDISEARVAADTIAEPFANVQIQNKDELVADLEGQIDALLQLIFALLFLAIIIAILGITNTLALSIIERTREIGLLRAVGMTRRQTRRMVRWEGVIIALFGAVMGTGIGLFLGWAVVQALADEGLGSFTIPWGQIAVLVVASGVAGVVASIYPAWKASRMNVLDAIAYE